MDASAVRVRKRAYLAADPEFRFFSVRGQRTTKIDVESGVSCFPWHAINHDVKQSRLWR